MKTFGSLKNRRLAYTLRNHAVSDLWVSQVAIMFNQRSHWRNMTV